MVPSSSPSSRPLHLLLFLSPFLFFPLLFSPTVNSMTSTALPSSTPRFFGGTCPYVESYKCALLKDRIESNLYWACNSSFCCPRDGPTMLVSELCPITCGLCPERCPGLTCINSGKIDYKTCTCQCPGHLGGPHCEDCVEQDDDWCSYFLPRDRCGTPGGPMFHKCPHFCGLCPHKCGGKECQNYGVLNIQTCECECRGLFTGTHCEICPPQEENYCNWIEAYCDQNPHMLVTVQFKTNCPYTCGVCSLEGLTTPI